MKYILFISMLFCLKVVGQDCNLFDEGIFELKGSFGTIITERKGSWQLEKSMEYDVIYLNKIEKISDCKFISRYYKIVNQGVLPKPDTTVFATTEIVNIINNQFFFKSVFSNNGTSMEGRYVKISNDISDEFKKLIAKEEKSSN